MTKTLATMLAMVVTLGVGLSASAATVAGAWTVTIDAAPPHGALSAALTLKQDGTKVTGIFASEHTGNAKVEGEFVEGQLKLTLSVEGADASQATTLTAKLKDENTLSGYVSGPMGDMTWTAKRAKDAR